MSRSSHRIVICGAGIAGVAAAYRLAVVEGCRDVTLVDPESPLTVTSDKSTEAYRNWWPGPDRAMTAFMNRSIDLLEALARETNNRFNMSRKGYLFASADPAKAAWLIAAARQAEAHGAGPVRIHDHGTDTYRRSPERGFAFDLDGADVLQGQALVRRHFPYLNPETCVVAHARRAGWLSAQQLGMTMLEAARAAGVRLVKGTVADVTREAGRLAGVVVEGPDGRDALPATRLVLAAGPGLPALAERLGLGLPLFAERHLKISLSDPIGAVPREAPMLIWLDGQALPWSEEERELLAAEPATRWLTEPFPAGVHGRPDGAGGATTLLVLFNYHNEPVEIVFPVPEDPHYAEIALRGMTTMVPALKATLERGVRPYVDGGYYVKTRENRPLIGPTAIEGVIVSGGYSGFGIMASMAGAELAAAHVLGRPLPDYAGAFLPQRYDDPEYVRGLEAWGDGSQL